jgi:hypothetical protein
LNPLKEMGFINSSILKLYKKTAYNTRLAPFANLVELPCRTNFSLNQKLSGYELPAISKWLNVDSNVKKYRMKTKNQNIIFLIITILFISCSNDEKSKKNDEDTQNCKEINISMVVNGEKQTYYVNQSGISLNSDGGYTLEIKMDRQENSDLRGKQGIDIILPYKKIGVNVIKNFIYHHYTDNFRIDGDFVTGEFQSVVVTNKNTCFYATFSGKLKNGNQEVIVTDGSISYQYYPSFSY